MTGGEQRRLRQSPLRPRGHGLVLVAGALTTLTIVGIVALAVGYGRTIEAERAPAGLGSQAESGVETEAPGDGSAEGRGLRPSRLAVSVVLLGLPLVVVAVAAVARSRRRAIAARAAATAVLALWTPLFVATGGAVFLLAAMLTGIATGLAFADRPRTGASM